MPHSPHSQTLVPAAAAALQMGFCSIRQQYSPELVRERAIGSLPALLALAGRGIQISWEVRCGVLTWIFLLRKHRCGAGGARHPHWLGGVWGGAVLLGEYTAPLREITCSCCCTGRSLPHAWSWGSWHCLHCLRLVSGERSCLLAVP